MMTYYVFVILYDTLYFKRWNKRI